ncbi:MAG: redox-regulated ATPase YchF [Chlorobi bacterium]|nr:redox-regulated ATPase YchF [Chlorobiota bacterium]
MSLQCGIIGLANTGKTTLFNCMSSNKAEVTQFAFGSNKSNVGIIPVPDTRLQVLEKLQPTEKVIHATVEVIDIPGLTKGASQGEGVGNRFLSDIRNCDALIHVLRCFDNDALPHIEGSVDPVRDMEIVDFELQVKDLESVDKKLQKVEKLVKTGDKNARRNLEILKKIKSHLENFQPVRTLEMNPGEKNIIRDMFLLTDKPVLYVCNVDEASATDGNAYTRRVQKVIEEENAGLLIIAAAMEAEIAELDDPADRLSFLNDLGLNEPGVNKLVRAAYGLLNLETFFTVGPKEIRAWTIRKGITAPMAAGVIHSDLERGFIRAEVMKYEDFIKLGSENACKDAGKLHIEGKNYIVKDGDILHIRFNI